MTHKFDIEPTLSEERPSQKQKRVETLAKTVSPLGRLIQNAMQLLELSYQQIVSESNRLAKRNDNPDMRIGKSTLGNIISGGIRQPGTAKLDSLSMILHLSRDEIDLAIGLAPERRLADQLWMRSGRTYELSLDAITRHQLVNLPILREDVGLKETQFLGGIIERWLDVHVEYLASFYPPYLKYVVVGDDDFHAVPVAPPGTCLLVNALVTQVRPTDHTSFHERELYFVRTPNGLTCSYLELTGDQKIILVPHPLSGRIREEFFETEITVLGQVVGLFFPASTHASGDQIV